MMTQAGSLLLHASYAMRDMSFAYTTKIHRIPCVLQ